MRCTVLSGWILGLFLFCFNHVLVASEADELRERAKAMRKEAERLEQGAADLLEAAERMEPNAKEPRRLEDRPSIYQEQYLEMQKGQLPNFIVQYLKMHKGRLQNLTAQYLKMQKANASEQELDDVREQIAEVNREIRLISARHAEPTERPEIRQQVKKLEIAGRRIHQMRVAAKHLQAAELPDHAHEVMKKADAMERDVLAAKQRLAAEIHEAHGHREDQVPRVVIELREEIERLRSEVKELSERVEKQ